MPFERKTGYKLKFINENDFEIICLDCNDTNSVRQQLKDAGFVTDIKTVDEKDKNHLQKIIGGKHPANTALPSDPISLNLV
ncbi:hypothetical protein ACFMJ0_14935, partial [Acinetobacter baumannii]